VVVVSSRDAQASAAGRIEAFAEGSLDRVLGAVAFGCGGDRDVAQDAVAEAVARAWDQLSRGRSIDNLDGWVYIVATNEARRQRGRRSRSRTHPQATTTDIEEHVLTGHVLSEAVTALPRRQREAVVLYYWLDLPVDATAEAMGAAPGTVKALLHQARSNLRDLLRDKEPTP
jgi:RNA polymerase sigma factor (sigma-70 family)